MYPWTREGAGRLDELVFDSRALADNPLGDPHRRPVWVYTPPGYDDVPDRRYPTIYLIQGLTGQLDMWRNRAAFSSTTPEEVDALFSGGCPPTIVVYVDAWTSLGGSQFLDSPGTGRYHTYLCDEVVPWVDAGYRTIADRDHRAIAGKSSGGYGAMVTPMLRPDLFGAFATHAGDALFEACYLPEFREAARALRDAHQGSYEAFWADFRARPGRSKPSDGVLLNAWCMAACYSTDPDGTVHLPFEPDTGRLVPEIWDRWLRWDPV
ncbi:MAG: alpha/beta hydrolase-fold protein, partial [Chloroflexota bacterium]